MLKVFRYKCKFVYTFTRRIHRRDIKCATDNSLISRSRIRRNAGIARLYVASEVYSICVANEKFLSLDAFYILGPICLPLKGKNVWCTRRETSSNVDGRSDRYDGCLFNVRITPRDPRAYYFESARLCIRVQRIYIYSRILLLLSLSVSARSLCKSSERKRILLPLLAD